MKNGEYIKTEVKKRILEIYPAARIIFYGSRARGDAREDSDWDFLVIVNENDYSAGLSDRIRDSIFEYSTEINEDLMAFVNTKEHIWKFQLAPFYQNIKREGIEL